MKEKLPILFRLVLWFIEKVLERYLSGKRRVARFFSSGKNLSDEVTPSKIRKRSRKQKKQKS